MHNKKKIIFGVLILIIVFSLILVFLLMPKKFLSGILEKNPIEKINTPEEKLNTTQNNTDAQVQFGILPDNNSKKSLPGGGSSGGGGGGGAGAGSLSNALPGLQPCPSSLDVEYLIDYKQTVTPTDDDVYLGIRNNKQLPEFIDVSIDDLQEGTLQISGLGLSVIRSLQITSWWRPLNLATQKTFSVLLTPESCRPISTTVTVTFPPSEGDYLD